MRIVEAAKIAEAVQQAVIDANMHLPVDLETELNNAYQTEDHETAKEILGSLLQNLDAAREMRIPICQDTGMTVVFADVGQEVYIKGSFEQAINDGVKAGYKAGYLRCSVVADPLERVNTGDNTPAVIHTRLTPGDEIELVVAPKGFGSENMSRIRMFNPSAGEAELIDFVVESVRHAGSNPCPPVVIGIGIGGDFELCAQLAKRALCRPISQRNTQIKYAQLEERILQAVNETNIGPQGFGGKTTALAVMIESFPTHIAGLPVALNMGCHVTRHVKIRI